MIYLNQFRQRGIQGQIQEGILGFPFYKVDSPENGSKESTKTGEKEPHLHTPGFAPGGGKRDSGQTTHFRLLKCRLVHIFC